MNVKLAPTFPWIDNCLKVTKLLKVGCLPYAVGKQLSIPLINLGRTWTLNWRWWWWMYAMNESVDYLQILTICTGKIPNYKRLLNSPLSVPCWLCLNAFVWRIYKRRLVLRPSPVPTGCRGRCTCRFDQRRHCSERCKGPPKNRPSNGSSFERQAARLGTSAHRGPARLWNGTA